MSPSYFLGTATTSVAAGAPNTQPQYKLVIHTNNIWNLEDAKYILKKRPASIDTPLAPPHKICTSRGTIEQSLSRLED